MPKTMTFRASSRSLEARRLALSLMAAHGLHDWTFAFNNRRRCLGYCWHPHNGDPGRIELSVHYTEIAQVEDITDTILHEIAHALVGPKHGHDHVWKAKCREIGAKPVRCSTTKQMPPGPWQARCGGCQNLYSRYRRPRAGGYHCRRCGRQRGALVFTKEQ